MEQRTLTERLERVEKILSYSGFGSEDLLSKEEAKRQYRDEQIRYEQMSVKDQDRAEELAQQKDIRFQRDFERRHTNEARADKAAPIPKAFEEIVNRIQTGTDRICMIAGKLEEIGNRVYGAVSEDNAGLGGAERAPDGMLDHTFIALHWLDQSLCRLHQAAARLEHL